MLKYVAIFIVFTCCVLFSLDSNAGLVPIQVCKIVQTGIHGGVWVGEEVCWTEYRYEPDGSENGGDTNPPSGGNYPSGGTGGTGGGMSGAELAAATAYSECVSDAESWRSTCVQNKTTLVNIASDICFVEAGVGGGIVGIYASPLGGVGFAAFAGLSCVAAKYVDLDRVAGLCDSEVTGKKNDC